MMLSKTRSIAFAVLLLLGPEQVLGRNPDVRAAEIAMQEAYSKLDVKFSSMAEEDAKSFLALPAVLDFQKNLVECLPIANDVLALTDCWHSPNKLSVEAANHVYRLVDWSNERVLRLAASDMYAVPDLTAEEFVAEYFPLGRNLPDFRDALLRAKFAADEILVIYLKANVYKYTEDSIEQAMCSSIAASEKFQSLTEKASNIVDVARWWRAQSMLSCMAACVVEFYKSADILTQAVLPKKKLELLHTGEIQMDQNRFGAFMELRANLVSGLENAKSYERLLASREDVSALISLRPKEFVTASKNSDIIRNFADWWNDIADNWRNCGTSVEDVDMYSPVDLSV